MYFLFVVILGIAIISCFCVLYFWILYLGMFVFLFVLCLFLLFSDVFVFMYCVCFCLFCLSDIWNIYIFLYFCLLLCLCKLYIAACRNPLVKWSNKWGGYTAAIPGPDSACKMDIPGQQNNYSVCLVCYSRKKASAFKMAIPGRQVCCAHVGYSRDVFRVQNCFPRATKVRFSRLFPGRLARSKWLFPGGEIAAPVVYSRGVFRVQNGYSRATK